MANRTHQQTYYANPAFCQQSEFYSGVQRSQIIHSVRQSPVGAQTPLYYRDNNNGIQQNNEDEPFDEQEFYEEMLVDDAGVIKEKKFVVISSPSNERQSSTTSNKYDLSPKGNKIQKTRYEYIPMQEQQISPKQYIQQKEISSNRLQRYAVIETTPNEDLSKKRINHRYEYIDEEYSPQKIPTFSTRQNPNRYDYIPQKQRPTTGNPIATQKLHELLSTPPKKPQIVRTQSILSPTAQRRVVLTQSSPHDPFITPQKQTNKSIQRNERSKAQQKLNYTLDSRQLVQQDKRHNTAVIAPICSSPIQTVYGETTYSNKSGDSWMNISNPKKPPVQTTLAVAAFMMMLCGGVTSALCFYMVAIMGRLYFLDFGTVAGFTCLVLGILGFRTRNCFWLPNRNYISGYIVLSLFSLLTCAGLLVLLVLQPKPGTPLADMTSGAVCGISVLSIILAMAGVIASYCCKYPPPDNRVEHCVQGFTV